MKIEGLFLTSRAGRRIFWILLAAAAVPILFFGLLTHDALNDHFASQSQRQRVQMAKYSGMGLLDNLVVARTVLEIVARTGRVDADSNLGNRRGRVLGDLAAVANDGTLIAGSREVWDRWHGVLPSASKLPGRDAATLVLGHHLPPARAVPILLVVYRADPADRFWIAEIDSDFLFGELQPDGGNSAICVLDTEKKPLFCPMTPSAAAAIPVPAGSGASWSLFLRSDFGVDDWTLVNRGSEGPAETLSLARTTALGAVATLLLVIMLSLVQVRRTMVPLERLIAGTRRLARRDFAARVAHDSSDEFGELAQSFNHMAERIGSQVEAMQVQSSIDHEILNGLDVARILQQVARRVAQLVPGAEVLVVELDRGSNALARVHQSDAPFTVIGASRAAALCTTVGPGDGLQLCHGLPHWLSGALRRTAARTYVQRACMGDEPLAVLVLSVAEDRPIESADTLREIDELRDRVAVALASADRERRLRERATRDSLTGLSNRSGLLDHLEQRLSDTNRDPFSVMFVDLDRFKEVNDALGHQAGDELLRTMAHRLLGCAPSHALVARPGGDEFVLIVPGPRSAADTLGETLLAQLAEPLALQGRMVNLGASIGVTHHPEDGGSTTDLLRRADMAMYSAKARGGQRMAWFEAALDEQLAERTALLADLRHALGRAEFELHYQPRVDVRAGRVRSAEALLRWRHPRRGLVAPGAFIGLLEETGLIDAVGLWAIETACRQLQAWRAQGLTLDSVAVNLSTRQLHAPRLVDAVSDILRRSEVPAAALELEITESIFIGNSAAAIAAVQALSRLGVRIALDDFGTGYSSLSYLQKLPIGILKVDRSFVCELGVSDSALAVTRSIVALARALHLQVIAEGVETEQQSDLLLDLGCDELQGYLFARPMPPQQLAAFVAQPLTAGRRLVEVAR